jgi:beta-N-acetylhexosaminidase
MKKWNKIISPHFIIGIRDFEWSQELDSFLDEFPIAGLSLFNSPHDSKDFIWNEPQAALEKLYEFLRRAENRIRFLAADQEGGRVRRLRKPFISLPPAQKVGDYFREGGGLDKIFELYHLAAQQLSLAGVQINFAPVCDLRTSTTTPIIQDRSFSAHSEDVIRLSKIFCEAMETASVRCVLKHFPGHGPTTIDSHESIAIIDKDPYLYDREDRKIFEECAGAAFGIMTAHVALPDSPHRILSLDADFIRGCKHQMPTHLIWMTDDLLTMKAVNALKPWISCFEAGYHYINLCNNLDESASAIEDVIHFLENSDLSFEETQAIEVRSRHSLENFQWSPVNKDFKKWKQSILDLQKLGEDLLHLEGLS